MAHLVLQGLYPGVKRLPPVGLTPFSVGDGGAALDDGVVVVVVVCGRRRGRLLPTIAAGGQGAYHHKHGTTGYGNSTTGSRVITIHVPFVPSQLSCQFDSGRRAARSARAAPESEVRTSCRRLD